MYGKNLYNRQYTKTSFVLDLTVFICKPVFICEHCVLCIFFGNGPSWSLIRVNVFFFFLFLLSVENNGIDKNIYIYLCLSLLVITIN